MKMADLVKRMAQSDIYSPVLVHHMVEAHELNATTNSSTTVAPPTPGDITTHASPTNSSNDQPCQWILHAEINASGVRIWDLIILLPNTIFLLFLIFRLRTAIAKLRRTSSPIFFAFYGMVFMVAIISVLRCVVSMTVNAASEVGDVADKVLWLVLRFFLLATEMSVVTFGLAFGHLDSKTSIRRVLLVTSTIALIYSSVQGVLDFMYPDDNYHVRNHQGEPYDIFGHGGMLFWFISSLCFAMIYTVICVLPITHIRHRFALPTKRSFYYYCFFLACLNLTQAIGSGLLYYGVTHGMCVVDVTSYIYFTCFAPLVYGTFLREFFATSQPANILFSYKAQVDESLEEDTVSLPHQISYANAKLETDLAMSGSYDSTHFDASHSPNPLYNPELHMPISAELGLVTDYYGAGRAPESSEDAQPFRQRHVDPQSIVA